MRKISAPREIRFLLLLIAPLVFFSLFFLYPLGTILFRDQESGLLARVGDILTDKYTLRIIGFTFKQALLSTVLAMILGLPGAYILAKYDFKGKNLVRAITTVPFVLPSILVVLGFVLLFGNNGLVNNLLMNVFQLNAPPFRILYSLKAILLAHAFYNFPVCIRIVNSVWSRINPRTEEAAKLLGARGLQLFRRIVLPQILPGILAASALIFIFCFMSFAVVLVLGGGPKFTTLEVEIYRMARIELDLSGASGLAIVGSSLTLVFLYLYLWLQKKSAFSEALTTGKKNLLRLFRTPGGWLILLYCLCVLALIVGPMLTVVHNSFLRREGWAGATSLTLDWYGVIFSRDILRGGFVLPYLKAIRNSMFFGAMTVFFSLPLGTMLAMVAAKVKKGFLVEGLMMLPLGVSAVILSLGYLKGFASFPLEIIGRWYSIVLVHTIIAYPFVLRSVSGVLQKIEPNLREAARNLGASSWKLFWHIEFPLIRPGILTGAAFAFAISLGEVTATLMLSTPDLITIPVAIYRLVSSYNFFAACAMGTLLMIASLIAFWLIDKLGQEVF